MPKTKTGPYVQEVLAIGTPLIWWSSIPALLFCLAGGSPGGTGGRAAVLCFLAGWATWLPWPGRTKFYYYALEFEPFVIICIVLCLGLIIGPATAGLWRRRIGASVAGAYILVVGWMFWYFYPILAARLSRTRTGCPTCGTAAGYRFMYGGGNAGRENEQGLRECPEIANWAL